MSLEEILSIDDPRLEPFRHLKDTNTTRWSGTFIVEGDKLVERLLASKFQTLSVLVSRRFVPQFKSRLPECTPLYVVPNEWIEQIVGFNFHRGVLACARRKPSDTLDEICSRAAGPLTLIICPDVQDPENLGSIVRTASALGANGVILGDRCGDPFSRRVLRVSMGAVLEMPIVECRDIIQTLVELRTQHGLELWATVLGSDAHQLHLVKRPNRLALLFGSEGHGLEPRVIAACDRRVTIPMRAGIDSLNVSVTAGIFLHHVMST